MRSLARSIRRPDKGGEPLPTVYLTFEQNQVAFRRGEVAMIAGQPGSGKSSMGVDIARKVGVPTLYFSADSTELTMASRLAAVLTGKTTHECERDILADPMAASRLFQNVDHIRWCFESAPSFEYIALEVEAFEEVW